MEMTMKMPTNYVDMTDEEMMYVDGGYYFSAWSYTGVAVSTDVLGFLLDTYGGGALASALGISINSALQLLGGFASYKMGGLGTAIARALDTNGNGWVGLYTRNVYSWQPTNSVNASYAFIGTEHKTI